MSREPKVVVLMEPRAISVETACDVYGMSRSQLGRLRADHGFPSVQIGRKVLIPVRLADEWIEQHVGQVIDGRPS